jgi:Ni,Fe-hydrogenase maturation factor
VVIGIGNEFRHDDGAGPAVVSALRDLAPAGEADVDVFERRGAQRVFLGCAWRAASGSDTRSNGPSLI